MYNFTPVVPEAVPSVTKVFCAAVKAVPLCVQVMVGVMVASNWYEHVIVTGAPLSTFVALVAIVTSRTRNVCGADVCSPDTENVTLQV